MWLNLKPGRDLHGYLYWKLTVVQHADAFQQTGSIESRAGLVKDNNPPFQQYRSKTTTTAHNQI